MAAELKQLYLNLLKQAVIGGLYQESEPDVIDNLEFCATQALEVPGDFMECGGTMAVFLRGLLKVHGDTTRRLWVAGGSTAEDFRRYGLLDARVRFCGLRAPIRSLALLRLVGDAGLEQLYPKVSPGGFVILEGAPWAADPCAVRVNEQVVFWRKPEGA